MTDLLVEHFGEFVDLEFTARMEERLDEVASGERPWVPLLREFYGPLKTLVDEKRRELKRKDFTTEPTDEVCSEGHPMVIRLGRNGRFLACSLYPEHKESRPLPGRSCRPMPGHGRSVPGVRRDGRWRARRPGAAVRPVRRMLALPGLQSTSSRRGRSRPPRCRSPSRARSAGRATSRPAVPAARAACSGAARATRRATSRRRASRSGPSTTRTTDRSPARATRRSACAAAPR